LTPPTLPGWFLASASNLIFSGLPCWIVPGFHYQSRVLTTSYHGLLRFCFIFHPSFTPLFPTVVLGNDHFGSMSHQLRVLAQDPPLLNALHCFLCFLRCRAVFAVFFGWSGSAPGFPLPLQFFRAIGSGYAAPTC